MSEKRIMGRAIQKHDIEENWLKATNFTPMQGEIIVYDIDENYNYERFKIGDGESNVNDLPFAGSDLSGTVLYTPQTLTEEQQTQARTNIGAVSEEDVIDIIENGTEQQVNATGELVEFNFEKEMPITVISKIHRDSTWELSNQLVLHQVKGNNFVDFSTYLGGAGTVIEKNGVTATINNDSTITIQGTNTSTGNNLIINQYRWSGDLSARVYPAGTYTIPKGFMMAIRAAKYPANEVVSGFGNLEGTVTIPVPFRIIMLMYAIIPGATINVTIPLGLYRGKPIPEDNYEYIGNVYTATFNSPIYEGEFNWTTGELKDANGNTIGYYEVPEIVGLEGTNYFWTCFGENTIINRQEKKNVLVQLNETVPVGSMPSICDFEFKPTTPFCAYDLSNTNVLSTGKFFGQEIPFLTTKGNLIVTDKDQNIKINKYIDSLINVNRSGWNVSDRLTQNGIEKAWSKKFYMTKDEYVSYEEFDYGAAKNSRYVFEFDESDFAETGIPAKLDNIPVASPCFYTGNNSQAWLNDRVYGGHPFPLKFSYNKDTGKYTMTIRGLGAGIIFHQLTNYSKTYLYYQLETPYIENDFFAMGLEEGDTILFENDYSYIQEYLDTNGFFHSLPNGGVVTDSNTTPTISAIVPQNIKEALNGFSNTARILNEKQKASEEAARDYSWIGDGDGTTDYTSTIQNKIKELHTVSNGGTIFLGNGVYNISNFIELYSNIKLIGTGNTVIQQTNKEAHVIVISGSNISIKDLKLKLYAMTTEEKDALQYNPELTACIYINSDNNKNNSNYDSRYSENTYCQHITIDNVYMSGSYGFKWVDGYPIISNDYEHYRGCGLLQEKLYFNYATLTNVHISGMYHGLHGVGGSTNITVFCESCKTMVYGEGGYNNLNIFGHSYYGTDINSNTISMSDEIGHFTAMEQSYIAEYVYDTQWVKNIFVFDGHSMNNRYIISQIAGSSYFKNDESDGNKKLRQFVIDYGRGNRPIENFQNTPYHIGSKYIEKTGLTSFKANDPITQNALSGAGVWGNISSNDAFDAGSLSLSELCRYPNSDNDLNKNHQGVVGFFCALSHNTPSEEKPIEILIDISNRPIYALSGCFIQFSHSYVASDFEVSFNYDGGDKFGDNIIVKDNVDTVWYYVNTQRTFKKIYKIKIVITKALYIESLKYQNSGYTDYEIEYNPERKVGICNVGIADANFAGRTFLGECGGNVYGDLTLNKNSTIKNVPTPVEDGDAVNKAYVDSIGTENSISTYYDKIINTQEEFNEMVADSAWLGARNILLNCDVNFINPLNTDTDYIIPNNVHLLDGNNHTILFEYWAIIGNSKIIIKNTYLDTDKTRLKNLYGIIDCTITDIHNTMPLYLTNCKNIINLTYDNTYGSEGLATFNDCENIWLTTEQATKFDTTNIGNAKLHIVDKIPSYVYISRVSDLENNLGMKAGEGLGSVASGAVGVSAEGDYSVATGYAHTVNGVEYFTTAKGTGSTAMGKGNTTYGKQSVAFGCYSTTGDKNGTAWDAEGEPFAGSDTPGEDLGKNSIAAGYNNSAWGESTVAMGSSNTSKGKSSTTIGNTNTAYGYGNVALGVKNTVGSEAPKDNDASKLYYGHGGSGAQNTQSNSAVGIGRENEVTDTQSVGIGTSNKLYSKNVLGLGTSNTINTNGDNSVAIGKDNEITNTNSVSLGYNNIIDKANAIAIGSNQIVGKNNQIVIGNGGVEEEKADIILNGPTTNLLSLSESDGAYTYDVEYHEFTYPIADCRYHNYNSTARGPVFVADMTKANEVPHLIKGQKIIIVINGVEYNSTINEVWGTQNPGSFGQNDVFGNSKTTISGAAFRIHESTQYGSIYTALNALGNIDTLKDSVIFKIQDFSLNLASLRAEEKTKTINAVTLGKNPSISSGTIFAIGNAANLNDGNEHNAFEVKNNGDIIVHGNLLNPDGTNKLSGIDIGRIPTKLSEFENDTKFISNKSTIDGSIEIGTESGANISLTKDSAEMSNMWLSSDFITLSSHDAMSLSADNAVSISAGTGANGYINVDFDKVSISGSNGIIDVTNNKIINVDNPVNSKDAANKEYVDEQIATLMAKIEELMKTI